MGEAHNPTAELKQRHIGTYNQKKREYNTLNYETTAKHDVILNMLIWTF